MTWSNNHSLPLCLSLLVAAGFLAGCAAHSARPGAVCGHCDYRFSRLTPNPCDPCVPEVILPGYGHTTTSWQVWPEGMIHSHVEPSPQARALEEVPHPEASPAAPPAQPMPPTSGMMPAPDATAAAMPLPDYRRPPALLR